MKKLTIVILLGSLLAGASAVLLAQDSRKPEPAKPAGKEAKKPAKVGSITGLIKSRWMRRTKALLHVKAIKGMKFSPPSEPAVMDQENLIFKPHLLAIMKGTTVEFPNSDAVRHNVYSPAKASAHGFNLGTYEVGTTKKVVLDKAGEVPLLCNVHAEMSAYIIVTETPFFAWTDKKGAFRIEGVPVGKRRLVLWHERFKSQEVSVVVEEGKAVEASFKKLKKR